MCDPDYVFPRHSEGPVQHAVRLLAEAGDEKIKAALHDMKDDALRRARILVDEEYRDRRKGDGAA